MKHRVFEESAIAAADGLVRWLEACFLEAEAVQLIDKVGRGKGIHAQAQDILVILWGWPRIYTLHLVVP